MKATFIYAKMEIEAIIVGAGPAGLGCALALQRAGIEKVLILDAETVGASFRHWPKEMRLITPSFHGNPFFQTDLNAITPDTSPADFSQKEHPSGLEYAEYLQTVAQHFKLKPHENERVLQIDPNSEGYCVTSDKASYQAKVVIWAGGEFSQPKAAIFEGAEHCTHSSTFKSWGDFKGTDALIIGGYESGIDAACNLAQLGKRVLVLSSGEPWHADNPDPSEILSPYTRERLLHALQSYPKKLLLRGNTRVVSVEHLSDRYIVETDDGEVLATEHRPIAATGFKSALTPIKALFEWQDGNPLFTEEDASTLHPGLYYTGPSLIQRSSKFCFIYKFRARFGVIARSAARQLGYPEPELEDDRRRGFLLDDLECCTNCECVVESNAQAVQSEQ